MPDAIRILIADDHEVVREGLRLILEEEEDLLLVGEAADGAEAVRLAGELRPHVVLMDLRMPGMDGIEAIERIRSEYPEIAIVILTTYDEDALMRRGLRAGARGYLLKDVKRRTLFDTLRAAARGEMLLQPEIIARLLSESATAETSTAKPPKNASALTERELQVLNAAARGQHSKEIARRLNITERTVRAHLESVYNKLGVDTRAAAIAIAVQRGWITPD